MEEERERERERSGGVLQLCVLGAFHFQDKCFSLAGNSSSTLMEGQNKNVEILINRVAQHSARQTQRGKDGKLNENK